MIAILEKEGFDKKITRISLFKEKDEFFDKEISKLRDDNKNFEIAEIYSFTDCTDAKNSNFCKAKRL